MTFGFVQVSPNILMYQVYPETTEQLESQGSWQHKQKVHAALIFNTSTELKSVLTFLALFSNSF